MNSQKPDRDYKWHWAEGNKYALEGIKTLLILNGGAAVALLAFLGNRRDDVGDTEIGNALLCFGIGALGASLVFISAYLTQLQYGNDNWSWGSVFHYITYILVAATAVMFLMGLWFARAAIVHPVLT